MNRYETFFILDPDIGGVDQKAVIEKYLQMIPQQNGTLLLQDDWGDRKFAYPIKKKLHGRYIRLDYCGNGGLVNDMERSLRIDYRVLKFMTILLDRDVDAEALKQKMEEAKALEKEKAEPAGNAEAAANEAADQPAEKAPEAAPEDPAQVETEKEE